ncbi:VCBS repeat-containing protein [Maribacter flavus]|uniref:VCBS repeat-containing protein n=1 Tax=Maribacter flavus TaxID=1658664 RepID=A0A5B2TPS1_9FLAO|nr:VCBS repeat-containing protein [Maribacter flavus]KAA2215570.1 VCBS repeat-containing protein [Maribacter flavus]
MKKIICITVLIALAFTSCQEEKEKLFTQIPAKSSGVDFNNRIIETDSFNILTSEYIFNGGGVAIGDFNNDDRPDIFFSGNQVSNKLYLNEGDFKFKDISAEAQIEGIDKWSTGIALVDINNDKYLDIYVCAAMLDSDKEKANMLFVNQGPNANGVPTFKEVAKEYGIADSSNSMGATFFDYDKDGDLDLYVLNNVDIHVLPSNYREKITDGSALSTDHLYRNNGDGTFTDVSLEAGITLEGYGLGLAIADINYDSWPDIYVSNDYLTNDLLYINNQDGTFTNRISEFVKHQSKFSMGNDISDFNNDGYLDIITLDMLGETNQRLKTTIASNNYTNYVLNERYNYEYQYSRNMLQKGNGNGVPFSEIGLMSGVSKTDWSWSPLFADMNNDGHKDLLITNGFPRDITDLDFGDFNFNVSRYLKPGQILDSIPTIKIPNYVYVNNGKDTFEDKGEEWGLNIPSFSNGAAFADLDNDGDLDYVVNNINDPAFIFRNNLGAENNYVRINLKNSDTYGIGAKVVVRFEDGTFQYHENYLYRGYMSSLDGIVHFGLGDMAKINSLEILWPNGNYQKLEGVQPKQTLVLKQSEASPIDVKSLEFPFNPKKDQKLFTEVSKEYGMDYEHKELDVIDFNIQRILPHKLTQNGPCLASGDLNGDGLEDFIVGSSARYSPVLFLQESNGQFLQRELFKEEEDKKYEEEGIALFDLDNDGDLDIYFVSGSNEFTPDDSYYLDRILVNDGKGNFSLALDKLPEIKKSGSVVAANDFNKDGFIDLFVGGRTPFAKYPIPESSYLLKNENGTLVDVTDSMCPELRDIGMVTDATWADVDSDGIDDLIVIGEFMPITVFKNNGEKLTKLEGTGMDDLYGFWESIVAHDFDKDGDLDFIVGNLGANNFYQPSPERPTKLVSKDFDNNGTVDPVMFTYLKYSFDNPEYRSFPLKFWGDLNGQSPLFRSKYNTYKSFANADINTLFTEEEMDGAFTLTGNFDRSIYVENLGNGTFSYKELPWETQMAPINSIAVTDYNNDGNDDVLLVGNDYGNEVFIGKYDASNGFLLEGDGKGNFSVVDIQKSGFVAQGDTKDITIVNNANESNPFIVVSQNRGPLRVFLKNE